MVLIDVLIAVVVEKPHQIELIANNVLQDSTLLSILLANNVHQTPSPLDLVLVLVSSVVKELNPMKIKLLALNAKPDSILLILLYVYLVLLDHSLEGMEQHHALFVHQVIKPTPPELAAKLVLLVLILQLELNAKVVLTE
jgi:hypothetical protein